MAITQRNYLIFFLVLILVCFFENTFAQSLTFNRLTVEDGLSDNKVNVVIQDRAGFIWFGTKDGLNRYDGYNFKIFRHNHSDTNSISNNDIWAMLEDHNGFLYVGTVDGILNRFDPRTETFKHFDISKLDNNTSSITTLFEDKNHNIWIGTRTKGIFKWNPSTQEIINYTRVRSDSTTLSHPSIRAITEDSKGNIIIGTYFGLNKFNPDIPVKTFQRFFHSNNGQNSIIHDQVYNLTSSKTNPDIVWIGTPAGLSRYNSKEDSFQNIKIPNPYNLQFGSGASTVIEELYLDDEILWTDTYGGLVRLNLSTGTASRFIHQETDQASLVDNRINRIIKDNSGVVWIATENGISSLSTKSTKFNSPFNQNYLSFLEATEDKKNLNAITANKTGDVWLGFSDGIIKMHRSDKNNEYVKSTEINNFNVWSLIENNYKSLWVGTFGQGLIEYNLNSFRHKEWILKFPKLNTRTVSFVKSLLIDSRNNLWVGYWGSGLGRIDLKSGEYNLWITQPSNPDAISHADVWSLVEDSYGRIWIGTQGGGLNLFQDENGGKFHHWLQNQNEQDALSNNNINAIREAKNISSDNSKTILWIGTSNGLNRFEIKNIGGRVDQFNFKTKNVYYTEQDGLPNNSVNSIIEDENGNLWIGTGSGISFFDIKLETFTNFSSADGINGAQMNPESAFKLENGLILIGSTKGLNVFNPEQIKLSSYKPKVVITDFQIFNKSVEIEKNSILKKSILTADEIIIPHDQDVFSFVFAALDYNSSQSIKYAYKMEGFDKDWIESENRRFATYTNLDPGEFIFKVKSTNADGVWTDNIKSLSVIISPPWWRTIWAYFIYIVLIVFGLIGIRRFELNRIKLRNELRLREFEVQKKTELEEVKSRFFANLSHEFRTPLMLIKGPLERLKEGKDNINYSENINLIERNSDRLKNLIDQLLELSQLEKAAIPLKASQENVILIIKGLLSSFESLAEQKNISVSFESDTDSKVCWIDRDKFEKIINNLLSNAFKFTPSGGQVIVSISELLKDQKQYSEIKISDTGVSIPKDKIDKIFNRFYQVDDSAQRSYGGSGVGLALVKEFVELHKWDISVQSEQGKGTEFTLLIPLWDDYLSEEEKINIEQIDDSVNQDVIKSVSGKLTRSQKVMQELTTLNDSNYKPSILIVDDSEDVRIYLSGLLNDNYKISLAVNGEDGIKTATENLPDLIISDIMMPSMDGIEFCSRIKSEWQTSDIPVILLTAKASAESKIEGLETGADDYLTKPFDSKELFARIRNLLEQRKRLREKYSKDINLLNEKSKLNKADSEFIEKTLALIEKNMDKNNFSTEQLAREMFVSRTQLHRKLLAITGQAPGEFVRTIKLKRSAELLIEGKLSVTQIAYEIGFSSPAQFTRAFVKQFNCVPSEYPTRQKK